MTASNTKRIGVLTSGGDAPGMNAAIRAVVRAGIYYGYEVFGIENGYSGLLDGNIFPMTLRSVAEIINRGGTILKTSRSPEFNTPEGVKRGAEMARLFKLDGLVIIGGDGSFRGARDLSKEGIAVACIPGTIDNDVNCTDYTIGYDTAMNTVKDAIDKIKDTAYSHERCSIIEVMGRGVGYIALNCAIAGGAEACILPEKPLNIDEDVIKPIIDGRNGGKDHFIIVAAEGVGKTDEIAAEIKAKVGITPTVSILGYIQRGGSPTVRDRVVGSLMGVKAVELLHEGSINQVVASRAGQIIGLPIDEALAMTKSISEYEILASNILAM